MNAGGVLNTCKSCAKEASAPESGERVSNTWVICLGAGDNLGKLGLIPHTLIGFCLVKKAGLYLQASVPGGARG